MDKTGFQNFDHRWMRYKTGFILYGAAGIFFLSMLVFYIGKTVFEVSNGKPFEIYKLMIVLIVSLLSLGASSLYFEKAKENMPKKSKFYANQSKDLSKLDQNIEWSEGRTFAMKKVPKEYVLKAARILNDGFVKEWAGKNKHNWNIFYKEDGDDVILLIEISQSDLDEYKTVCKDFCKA